MQLVCSVFTKCQHFVIIIMELSKEYLDIVTGFPEICSQYPKLFVKLLFCLNERNIIRVFNHKVSTKYLRELLTFGIVHGNWLCEHSTLAEGIHKHTKLCCDSDNLISSSIKGFDMFNEIDGSLWISPRNVTLNGHLHIHSKSAAYEFILKFFTRIPNGTFRKFKVTCCKTYRYKLEWNEKKYTHLCEMKQDDKILLPPCRFRNYCKFQYNMGNMCWCTMSNWRTMAIFGKEDMCFSNVNRKNCRKLKSHLDIYNDVKY